MNTPTSVGVLALQGDAPEHLAAFARLVGRDRVLEVRTPEDLTRVGALALPGGESTTLARLIRASGLREPLSVRVRNGMGILATCAGLIIISNDVERSNRGRDPETLSLLDVGVRRNDYGRQVDSFEEELDIDGLSGDRFRGYFIRAPRISRVGEGVSVLSSLRGVPVMVRSSNVWGLTFHPEIGADMRIHELFLRSSGIPL